MIYFAIVKTKSEFKNYVGAEPVTLIDISDMSDEYLASDRYFVLLGDNATKIFLTQVLKARKIAWHHIHLASDMLPARLVIESTHREVDVEELPSASVFLRIVLVSAVGAFGAWILGQLLWLR